ncbi:MAG: hypothetical protein HW380_1821 [Magnetococcales bacterium]|nr:hypothetical protein [Magnetococcales bacterium]
MAYGGVTCGGETGCLYVINGGQLNKINKYNKPIYKAFLSIAGKKTIRDELVVDSCALWMVLVQKMELR